GPFRKVLKAALDAAGQITKAPSIPRVDVGLHARGRSIIDNTTVQISLPPDWPATVRQQVQDHWRSVRAELLRRLLDAVRGRTWVLLVESYDSAAPSADDDFGEWFGRDLLPALARADQDVRVVVSGRERLPAGAWQELDIGAYSDAMDGHDPGSRG